MALLQGEYTTTTSDLEAPAGGRVLLDNTASAYGTISIDPYINGGYVVLGTHTFTEQVSKVIQLTAGRKHRVTVTGGTSPVVAISVI